MDSHAASYTGVLDSFFAAAITAHLMLEDWSFEPFNLWKERAHPLLLQWYHHHQQFHSHLGNEAFAFGSGAFGTGTSTAAGSIFGPGFP